MTESTWNTPSLPYYLLQQGWQPQYGLNGEIVGYGRSVSYDPNREQNYASDFGPGNDSSKVDSGGIAAGTEQGIEFVPIDQFNGGNFDPSAVQYGVTGTAVNQNNNEPFPGASNLVLGALGAIAGGAAGQAAGLWNLPGGAIAEGAAAGTAAGGTALPEITAEMIAAANATSDPIAYLAAQANAAVPGSWGPLSPAYLASLTTVPVGTTLPGYLNELISPSFPGETTQTGTTSQGTTPPVTPTSTGGGATPPTNAMVDWVSKTLGISPELARLILTVGGAALPVIAGQIDGDEKRTVEVSPEVSATRDIIAKTIGAEYPGIAERDKARAAQNDLWAAAAADAGKKVILPKSPFRQGMMGYAPRRGLVG